MQASMNGMCETPIGSLAPAASVDPVRVQRGVAWRIWFVPPVVLLLLAVAALSIDVPVAQWAHGRHFSRVVRELMSLAEAFGHGVGVSVVLLSIYTLDPARRRLLPRSILAVVASGCGANLLKLLISRSRPSATNLIQLDAWQTFGSWLPLGHNGSLGQSFPSAHTATAVGLALALSSLYPHGRGLFAAFAVAVGLQRVLGGAHFPSDVLSGAAVGWWCAVGVLAGGASHLSRFESEAGRPGLRK